MSNSLGEALLEQFQEAAALVTAEGLITTANARFATLVGLAREACRDRPLAAVLRAEEAEAADGSARSHETRRARLASGVPVEVEWRPLAGADDPVLVVARVPVRREDEAARDGFYRSLVENLPGIVYRSILHPDGRITVPYLSPATESVAEVPSDGLHVGADALTRHIHPDDLPHFRAALEASAARLEPHSVDVRFTGTDGRTRWLRSLGMPRRGEHGRTIVDGINLEITELKEHEEQLSAAEERFRDVVESTSDWIWEMDADLRFTFLSDRFQQVTGIDPRNALGLTRSEWMKPLNDPELLRQHVLDLEARRPFRELRYAYRDGRGRVRYQMVSGRPIYDRAGTFAGYRGTGTDITAQVEAERRLRESEQRFRHFAEAASDWMWEMDADLRFTFLSERLREVTGVDPASLIGQTRADVASSANDPEVWRAHQSDLEAHRPFKQFRYIFHTPDGRDLDMVISGIPLFGSDGTFRGYRGTATDVTAQVDAERAVAEQQALLAQAVDALAHGFALFDDQDRLLICNANYYKVLGFDHLEPGTPYATIVREAIRLGLRSERMPDLEALSHEFEVRHRRADGVPEDFTLANGHWIRSSKSRLSNGCTVTIQVDITEMKRREQALQESEGRFRELADATFEGILLHDGHEIIDVNRAFLELTGAKQREAVLGRALGAFFRPADKILERGDEGGVFESTLRLDDGVEIPVEAQCKTVHYQGRSVRVVAMRDISERRRTEAHIRHLAHHDALTGLPNRLRFRERLQAALDQHRRNGRRIAILQLDLDNFKDVNDTLGHHAGDMLLCEVAARLSDCVRESDTVARLGGDEFAVLLTGLARGADAAGMAQRIVDRLRDPVSYQGDAIHPGTSIGVTIFPDDDRDPEQLLKNADIALYRAKSNGRNGYSFFVSSMKIAVELRRTLEGELRQALERREFSLAYQPQVDLADDRVIGIEALLRWEHPERGLLTPNAFLAIAEETGLIVPIGEAVMLEVCRQAQIWLDMGLEFERVAINVAPQQFKIGRLVRSLRKVLGKTGLPAARLEIEITEGVFLGRGSEGVAEALRRLAQAGVRIALDDFGTGYASLAHLKRFPIDRLKIDQSFVRDIGSDPEDAAIVRTVLSLGEALGLEVVAEGVETVEQRRFLRNHGCRIAQGYLLSRPLRAEAMTLFLEGSREGRRIGRGEDVREVEPA